MIGLRGSVLGIGTDIGGSIRSPAANNGVFGFKPTSLRLPVAGWSVSMAGAEHVLGTIGPLSTSLEGIELFMKTVVDKKPWIRDPGVIPIEWRDTRAAYRGRKLRVGVMSDDGIVKPHPPVIRAISELVNKLKKSDLIEIVEWKAWRHDLSWSIIVSLVIATGNTLYELESTDIRPRQGCILQMVALKIKRSSKSLESPGCRCLSGSFWTTHTCANIPSTPSGTQSGNERCIAQSTQNCGTRPQSTLYCALVVRESHPNLAPANIGITRRIGIC